MTPSRHDIHDSIYNIFLTYFDIVKILYNLLLTHTIPKPKH